MPACGNGKVMSVLSTRVISRPELASPSSTGVRSRRFAARFCPPPASMIWLALLPKSPSETSAVVSSCFWSLISPTASGICASARARVSFCSSICRASRSSPSIAATMSARWSSSPLTVVSSWVMTSLASS